MARFFCRSRGDCDGHEHGTLFGIAHCLWCRPPFDTSKVLYPLYRIFVGPGTSESGDAVSRCCDSRDAPPPAVATYQWHTVPVELSEALELAGTRHQSVLVTMRANGRPQLSNVGHVVSDDGLIRILIPSEVAKYKNLLREPWASLHVTREDFNAYVVIEADVELSSIAYEINDETVDELVAVYRVMVGEQPDWSEFRERMVREHRVVVRLRPTRAYGVL